MKYINGNLKKTILAAFLTALSFPVAAQYKITFGLSSLDLPNSQTSEEPEVQSVLSFDGNNDYVKIIGDKGISGNNERTVEFTINTTESGTFDNRRSIIEWGANSTGSRYNIRIEETTGAIRVEVSEGYVYGSVDITDGQSHQVSVVFPQDATNVTDHKIYIDGILDTIAKSSSQSVNTGSTYDVGIGYSSIIADLGVPRYFEGRLDELRIWNTARTQTQIQNNMDKDLTGSETGLAAYYKFDSGSGTTAVDSAGNNDGTINGATWVEK